MTPNAKMIAYEAIIISLLNNLSAEKADSVVGAAVERVNGWIDLEDRVKEPVTKYLENLRITVTEGANRE